jgi:hypothetical protein
MLKTFRPGLHWILPFNGTGKRSLICSASMEPRSNKPEKAEKWRTILPKTEVVTE